MIEGVASPFTFRNQLSSQNTTHDRFTKHSKRADKKTYVGRHLYVMLRIQRLSGDIFSRFEQGAHRDGNASAPICKWPSKPINPQRMVRSVHRPYNAIEGRLLLRTASTTETAALLMTMHKTIHAVATGGATVLRNPTDRANASIGPERRRCLAKATGALHCVISAQRRVCPPWSDLACYIRIPDHAYGSACAAGL